MGNRPCVSSRAQRGIPRDTEGGSAWDPSPSSRLGMTPRRISGIWVAAVSPRWEVKNYSCVASDFFFRYQRIFSAVFETATQPEGSMFVVGRWSSRLPTTNHQQPTPKLHDRPDPSPPPPPG